ncbi:MAG: hypothetical protein RR286_08050, partial [Mucinivorans sp.]
HLPLVNCGFSTTQSLEKVQFLEVTPPRSLRKIAFFFVPGLSQNPPWTISKSSFTFSKLRFFDNPEPRKSPIFRSSHYQVVNNKRTVNEHTY